MCLIHQESFPLAVGLAERMEVFQCCHPTDFLPEVGPSEMVT
jgi:hypothetical protein